MTAELSNTNQLTADEMTVDTDASHTTPRHLTDILSAVGDTGGRSIRSAFWDTLDPAPAEQTTRCGLCLAGDPVG